MSRRYFENAASGRNLARRNEWSSKAHAESGTATRFAATTPKDDRIGTVALEALIGKYQGTFIGHAEHIQNRQRRRELYVLFVLLEARDGGRTHFCKGCQLLLRQVLPSTSPGCFFDKNCPVKANVPFHRCSIRSMRLWPSATAPTVFAESAIDFSAAFRRRSS